MLSDVEKIGTKRKLKKNSISEKYAEEWVKCQSNPLYYIYNYVYIPETGGKVKLTPENLHPKMKRVIRSVYNYHHVTLMASRQLGKSTVAACLLSWASVFFPRNRIVILNLKKNAALENLGKIKFIIDNLPNWMVTSKPFKQDKGIKTYVDLFNDSKIEVFYPSTVHSSDTIARSLTSPILYIDEAAHIKDMEDIYGSAQPILSKAREQAARNNYPYFTLVTSTPNGTQGRGKWFYERWTHGVETDEVFEPISETEEKWRDDVDINSIVHDPDKNTFLRVKSHWSEDPKKDNDWYLRQCQDLNNKRKVNQELDLIFAGTKDCIFDDEQLSSFVPGPPVKKIRTPHFASLSIFQRELSTNDYYLIGCDTAESLNGAFCAIEVFSFKDFNQVAELKERFGSYTAFADAIEFVFKWLYGNVGENIILCVENNSIGRAPIENLRFHKKDFNFDPYLYRDKIDKREDYGIKTTGLTKPLMAGCLIEFVTDNLKGIKSSELIDQFSSVERTNSGSIRSSSYSDLFMAACFCAYVRNKKAHSILPIIDRSPDTYYKESYDTAIDLIKTGNLKENLNKDKDKMEGFYYSENELSEDFFSTGDEKEDDGFGFIPFFNS